MEDLGVERKIILELVFKTSDGAWNRLIWLRMETSGGLLWKV